MRAAWSTMPVTSAISSARRTEWLRALGWSQAQLAQEQKVLFSVVEPADPATSSRRGSTTCCRCVTHAQHCRRRKPAIRPAAAAGRRSGGQRPGAGRLCRCDKFQAAAPAADTTHEDCLMSADAVDPVWSPMPASSCSWCCCVLLAHPLAPGPSSSASVGRWPGRASQADSFEASFWSGGDLGSLYRSLEAKGGNTGMSSIFEMGFREFARLRQGGVPADQLLEGARRAMKVAQLKELERLEHNLATLATIGSVSPYVGLFGTVVGHHGHLRRAQRRAAGNAGHRGAGHRRGTGGHGLRAGGCHTGVHCLQPLRGQGRPAGAALQRLHGGVLDHPAAACRRPGQASWTVPEWTRLRASAA